MVSFGFTVNTNNLPEAENNFEPIPAGMYQAMISTAEIKDTKSGGQMFKLTWDILGPAHAGRKVWQNINLRCPSSAKAEEIAAQQLGQVISAIGLAGQDLDDTDAFIGGNAEIKLTIRPADGQYEASNDVKGVRSIEGSKPPASAAPAQKSATPPWGKK